MKQPYHLVEKVCFFKKVLVLYPYKNALWALRPAKPLGVLSRHPCRNPKPLPRGEGLCMLGWLCVLQSLAAYTPGIRAGAILLGLPPLVPVGGFAPATPFLIIKRFIDNLFPLYKIFYFCDYSVRLFKYKPYCRRYECAGNNCGDRKKRKVRKYGQRIYKRSR